MTETHIDALVVGAGFGGIYLLRSFLKLGLQCKAVDKYTDLGGTWHANRYPGVTSDSYSRKSSNIQEIPDEIFCSN